MARFRILLAILTVVIPVAVLAQRTTTTISGQLSDPTGAAVPGAQITATETSTGAVIRAVSDAAGFYLLPNIPPGAYDMRTEKTGFQSYIQKGVVVEVDRPVTVNIALSMGNATQSVTVTAAPPQVDTRSATLNYEITTRMATDLPLNGRNVLQLATLAPDVSPGPSSGLQQKASRPEDANLYASADGGRGESTSFYLDSGINEDALSLNANIFPNPDAIQEFSVETNSYSAKFGGRGGAVVNAVTKGGTNSFHGDAFEFVRYYGMNGRNFFSSTQDGLKRNQFGFTIGGPIQKDRTFFFFSYQGTTLRAVPTNNVATVATAAERAGDFSSISKQLVNPNGGAPFAKNQVPTTLFDPIAIKLLALVPVGQPNTGLSFYATRQIQNDKQFVGRADHYFGNSFHLYGSYLFDQLDQPATADPNNLLTWSSYNSFWRSQNAAINGTWTLRPNLLATFVVSVSRRLNVQSGAPGTIGWTQLGANVPDLVTQGPKTAMQIAITGYFSELVTGYYTIPSTVGNAGTSWSWIKGNHSVEFGADVSRTKVVKNQDFMGDGRFNFGGSLSGNNLLDFMLGKPSEFLQQNSFYFVPEATVPSAFIQDTWKATRRLSVSLGLRWNPFVPLQDAAYHESGYFSQAAYNQGIRSKLYPNLPPGLLVQGDPGVPTAGINSHWGLFNPRVGLAWDVFGNGKTSVRTGYGMYNGQMRASTLNPQYSPFSVGVDILYPVSTANPYQGQFNPFPVPQPTPSNFVFPLPEGSANPFTPGIVAPTTQQWNFTIEQQLPASMLLRVAYEGSNSYHLWSSYDGNAAVYNPALTRTQNLAITNQRRPMGQWFQQLQLDNSAGTSNFNALVISVEKRFTHGVSLLAGYRWSKCLDETDLAYTMFTDPSNFRFDYARCGYDVPQQFRGSYTWQLPTPRALGFIGNHVLGGWQTAGIVTLQSGMPFTVTSGVDDSLTGIGLDRADIIGTPNLPGGRSTQQQLQQWFNPAAFQANALGTFGDAPRNFLNGPGTADLDLSLFKSFPMHIAHLTEAQDLDFRAEFFNALNHPNFGLPVSSLSSPTIGRVLSASDPRIIQLALKFIF